MLLYGEYFMKNPAIIKSINFHSIWVTSVLLYIFIMNPCMAEEGIILADSANIRSLPETQLSRVLFTLPFGSFVTVIDKTQSSSPENTIENYLMNTTYSWYQIETISQQTGWVYGKYILTGEFEENLTIIHGGLMTQSVYTSATFQTPDIEENPLILPNWSYHDTYIPDKYDIVLYHFNGTTTEYSNQTIVIQIDEQSGRKSADLIPPASVKWITNIRRHTKIVEYLKPYELQKIIIPGVNFIQDLEREQQMLPDNWIWKIRLSAQILGSSSPTFERITEIYHER